jgi:hypothetical protein
MIQYAFREATLKKRAEKPTDGCNFILLELLAIYENPSFFGAGATLHNAFKSPGAPGI